MLIKDHTFIVTGGASGLGEAVVRRLHADGANVIVGTFSNCVIVV
jgi:NAD(P)-dependent dehydrogenase (short-subunit alcohol dehydrogenase family)